MINKETGIINQVINLTILLRFKNKIDKNLTTTLRLSSKLIDLFDSETEIINQVMYLTVKLRLSNKRFI